VNLFEVKRQKLDCVEGFLAFQARKTGIKLSPMRHRMVCYDDFGESDFGRNASVGKVLVAATKHLTAVRALKRLCSFQHVASELLDG